jgi:molybdate transport system permease protein
MEHAMNGPGASSLRFLVAALTAVAVALFALPILGLVAHAPWSRLREVLTSSSVQQALRLSLISSLGAVAMAALFGLPLALWLAQGRSALRTAVRMIVTLPVVLPPIVAGIALLLAFGRNGIIGGLLERWFGWSLPFSTAATVVAAAYMGLPFFVLSAEAGLRALDPRYLAAAASLGAGPWRRLWSVTLPMIQPALRTGALLCWARALGEFCATQMFAGNFEGTTRTLPLACSVAMEVDPGLAIGLALILAALSLAVLSVLRHGWVPKP